MANNLKMDRRSIQKREYQRRYHALKRSGALLPKQENERRQFEKQYSFSLYEIDRLHLTFEGKETIIGRLTQEQFRSWFCGVVDAAMPHVRGGEALMALRRAKMECCQYEEIDDCVKHDLINTLYEMQAFRQSGVAFVTEAEMVSKSLPKRETPIFDVCLCGCGKEINTARQGGRVRKFYSSSCQSRYSRRQKKQAEKKEPVVKTHCPQGHPYSKENTYITKLGYKACRTCRKLRGRQSRQQEKANREEQAS